MISLARELIWNVGANSVNTTNNNTQQKRDVCAKDLKYTVYG